MKFTPLLLVLLLAACQTPAPPVSQAPTSQTQPEIKTASKVVALTSLSADIVNRLDKTKLVAISGSRLVNQNPDFAQLPRVSEGRTPPNLEKIVALKPDLVIGAKGFHDQALAKLQESGIQTLATEVNSWRSLSELTRTIATALNANPDPLIQSYQALLEPKPAQTSSVLVLASRQPILSPNKSSWAGDLLNQFAVKNVAAELQGSSEFNGYVTLSPEKLLQINPEKIILIDTGEGEINQLKSQSFWSQLKAVQQQQVYTMDYFGLVNPGSIREIEEACKKLKETVFR
ncbi:MULTISPECIES: ABC transporter substrate-binding protein [Leptolyngbya]|jgi:iron complex transport system substrate-binding protein|uniref:ABC-type transporter, periplasmic subunit n=1 Tax=Leptolyngbya boryana NIES-2135 TaxID=1973484 RepID=A0A1Z4JDX0_LEPBY|nr:MULTISPECIES: ABC transporter substrate-binding protein [Leptolyngbya]BAY54657.1 ABC-type transporter, periplasmic subunit [Leptolyngbya boryana NIES-2135]MBD2365650.1 ABC transporter substrate-binding protein [Leptolyngbya sp. FACHB-161]MBD2371830.1 ABC transporter substrate-binding protein [Leptolyngbya sp. FACHB-238]MBD2396255.1 ABC transporter substrate-binding protein [Leptolyngbya sp. FACHB-239]MBD2402777.1 ABC transporter substrate-binding protein [Leptolyngbya sp. FACHB-402]